MERRQEKSWVVLRVVVVRRRSRCVCLLPSTFAPSKRLPSLFLQSRPFRCRSPPRRPCSSSPGQQQQRPPRPPSDGRSQPPSAPEHRTRRRPARRPSCPCLCPSALEERAVPRPTTSSSIVSLTLLSFALRGGRGGGEAGAKRLALSNRPVPSCPAPPPSLPLVHKLAGCWLSRRRELD